MEACRIEVSRSVLQILADNGIEYKLLLVDEKDFDYSQSELWKAAKAKADKAYKSVKQIEFELRHSMPHD